MTFSIGPSAAERLEVNVLGYERSPVGEYYDDNWLTTKIRIGAGGFRGGVDASILTAELVEFHTQLRLLHETRQGTAEFWTLEEQLSLQLTGDGTGRIDLVGELADQPGIGNRLHFHWQLNQSQLVACVRELESVLAAFPVRTAR